MINKETNKSNLFSIDFDTIEKILNDANSQIIEKSDILISEISIYNKDINSLEEAENLKSFLKSLRSHLKDLSKARLSDSRPFNDAIKFIKKWFFKYEKKLKDADVQLFNLLSSYSVKRFNEIENLNEKNYSNSTKLVGKTLNEEPIIYSNTKDSKELNSEIFDQNTSMIWQVKDYDIKEIDLELLRDHFSPYALKNAINSHLKLNGPNQISGVQYERVIAKKL